MDMSGPIARNMTRIQNQDDLCSKFDEPETSANRIDWSGDSHSIDAAGFGVDGIEIPNAVAGQLTSISTRPTFRPD